jgi:hypothetical protein
VRRLSLALALALGGCEGRANSTTPSDSDASPPPDTAIDATVATSCVGVRSGQCTLATSPGIIRAITADTTDVYWIANVGDLIYYPDTRTPSILAARRDGTAPPKSLTTLADTGGNALDHDTNSLYVATSNAIWRVRKDGSAVETLTKEAASSLCVDGTDLYYTTAEPSVDVIPPIDAAGRQSVMRLSLVDGSRSIIASGQRAPSSVRVDGAFVVWASNLSNYAKSASAGRILRVPKAGGAPEVVVSRDDAIGALALAGGATLFTTTGTPGVDTWNADGAVMRLATVASVTELLVGAVQHPCSMVADARDAFVRECRYGLESGGRMWRFHGATAPPIPVGGFVSGPSSPMYMDDTDLIFTTYEEVLVLKR